LGNLLQNDRLLVSAIEYPGFQAERMAKSARGLRALQDAGAPFSGPHKREASWCAAAVRRFNLERNRTVGRPWTGLRQFEIN